MKRILIIGIILLAFFSLSAAWGEENTTFAEKADTLEITQDFSKEQMFPEDNASLLSPSPDDVQETLGDDFAEESDGNLTFYLYQDHYLQTEDMIGRAKVSEYYFYDEYDLFTFLLDGDEIKIWTWDHLYFILPKGIEVGNHTLTAIYKGNGIYMPQNKTIAFEVDYISEVVPNSYSNSFSVMHMRDMTGNISLHINGELYAETSIENVIKVDTLGTGTYKYKVVYSGDANYTAITRTGSFYYENPNPTGIIKANDLETTYKQGSTYKIKVYECFGKPAKYKKVTFKVNGKTVNTKTDKNGYATLKLTKTGAYKVQMTSCKRTVTRTMKIHTLALKKITVKKSAKSLTIQATLAKISTKSVKNKVVTFKFNGKIYKAKTNSKGVAKATIKSAALKKLKAGKTVTYQATYNKDTVKRTVRVQK